MVKDIIKENVSIRILKTGILSKLIIKFKDLELINEIL